MGMAASQGRLLQLTSRKHSIGLQLTTLSNQKMSLTREMRKVSQEYNDSLNAKVLKWSNNQGVTYTDISYSNLMHPSEMNQNTPYLLTNSSGQVVLDSRYQKYAAMVSPNGAPGGNWEDNRTKILSDLTGIDTETIDDLENYKKTVYEKNQNIQNLLANEPKIKSKTTGVEDILATIGSKTGSTNGAGFSSGSNWAEAYKNGATITLGGDVEGSKNNLESILTQLSNTLGKSLEKPEAFDKACETFLEDSKLGFEGHASVTNTPVHKDGSNFVVSVNSMIDQIMSSYLTNGGAYTDSNSYDGSLKYVWYDIESDKYKEEKAIHDEWVDQYNAAIGEYDKAVIEKNKVLTSEQESSIKFYDTLFSTIAEKGWECNSQVEDNEYLNQMLQNNVYTITTVENEEEYNEETGIFEFQNQYNTNIASNFSKIISVNDSDLRNDALVDYEYKKSIINAKEQRIDTRMKDLETEQSAINQMMQGIEQVRNDNIERTFSIFS